MLVVTALAAPCLAGEAEDQFNFATGLLIKKEYELAVEEFQGLLEKHPNFKSADVALCRLGDALYKLGRNDEAATTYKKVTANYPQSEKLPQAYYRLGEITSKKNHAEAAGYYGVIAERWPEHKLAESALYWSAEEKFRAKDYPGAAAAYTSVIARYPAGKYLAHSLYSLGWAESHRKRFAPSVKAFNDFLQKFPKHELVPECRLKLAESLRNLKRYDDAIAEYSRAAATGGKLAREAAIGTAWCLYDQGKRKEAAAAFTKAAEVLGKTDRAAVCIFNAGNALVETKDFGKAALEFSKIAADYPNHKLAPESRYWKGYCLVRLKRFSEAASILEALSSSGRLKEKEAEVLYSFSEARFGQKNYRGAATLYEAIVKKFPGHGLADEAAYGRMLALEKAGDLAGAEAAGVDFFAKFGTSKVSHLARFALAEYRFRLKKYREAAEDLTKFLAGGNLADLGDDTEYKLGWCAMNLNDAAGAVRHFAAVAAKHPESPLAAESAYMAGRASEDARQKPAARRHYEGCIRGHRATEHAKRSNLALMLMDLSDKKYDDALARAEAFLKKNPAGPLADYARVYKGEALIELGRFDEAMKSFEGVKGLASGAGADAVYGTAWALRELGRHREAAQAFLRVALLGSPKSEDAKFWGCRSLEDAGSFKDAAGHYGEFLTAHSSSARVGEAAYRQALCSFRGRRYDKAKDLYNAYLQKYPNSEFADNALYDLAWMNKERKNAAGAARRFQQILKEFPKSDLVPDVNFRLGEMAYDEKNYHRAVSYYEDALANGAVPFGDKVLYKLGWCRDRLGESGKAAETFSRIWKEFPKSELAGEAHYRTGRLLQESGRHADALKEYETVADGDFAERALFQAAECGRALGQHKEALEAYDGVLKKFPGTEFIHQVNLGRGHCLRALGAFKDALETYQSVVRATETVEAAASLLGIGYCHYAQGQYKDAAKAFLKVDILYGYEDLKPEALHMLDESWKKAGKIPKAKKYREELRNRYPNSKFVKG